MPTKYGRSHTQVGKRKRNTNLAMPASAAGGVTQAANLIDAFGVTHHPNSDTQAQNHAQTVAACQWLGIRHIRFGAYSPANYGGGFEPVLAQGLMLAIKNANASRGAGVQPLFLIAGTTAEPLYEQQNQSNSAVYTITTAAGTFLRPFDGPSGTNPGEVRGTSPYNGAANVLLENSGTYQDVGWLPVSGLQGPNEPDGRGTVYWTGSGSVRDVLARLKAAKNARTAKTVLGGADYIDSVTGRITQGPATANQLPVVGPHLRGNHWTELGSAGAVAADLDVGNRHTYWGGHGPNYTELVEQWDSSASYVGLPRFCTETGYRMRAGYDDPSGERHTPHEVGGEYILRTYIHHARQGIRRTYIHTLHYETATAVYADVSYGMFQYDWSAGSGGVAAAATATAHAMRNLVALIGWSQGPANETAPSFAVTGFTAGADKTLSDGYVMPDRLDKLIVRRSDCWLVILVRQRELWDRGLQDYITVPDPKTVTIQLPANATSAAVAEPAKNPILDPNDGLTYPNTGDGQAYSSLTINGSKQVSLQMGGLTRVVKVTTT